MLQTGQIIATRNIRDYFERGWVDFSAAQMDENPRERDPKKKHVFVMMLLGTSVIQPEEPFEVRKRLNELGWYGLSQIKEALTEKQFKKVCEHLGVVVKDG